MLKSMAAGFCARAPTAAVIEPQIACRCQILRLRRGTLFSVSLSFFS
jgi:hypothetical protein